MADGGRLWGAVVCFLLATGTPQAASGPIAPSPPPLSSEREWSLRVKVVADAPRRDRLSAEGFDIAGHNLPEGWVEVITDAAGLERLLLEGFEAEVLSREPRPVPLGGDAGTDAPFGDTLYTDPAELAAFLNQVVADHPAITRLETLGYSRQGRPILGLLISDNAALDEDELSILLNGAHHAREVMTPEIVMDIIDYLTNNYGSNPDVTARVNAYQIWCVPMVNPDGVNLVFTYDQIWRKNARDNDGNSLIDSQDGVDLNRNYEWGWGNQCQGSSGIQSSETYRGPSEGSEPEIQTMVALGRRITPVFDVEYHSYGEAVYYAMSCDPTFDANLATVAGDGSISRVIAQDYASRIVQADGGLGYTPAPYGSRVDGTGRDHQYHDGGTIAVVTEVNSSLEGGFYPSYATWRNATVAGHRASWLWLIDRLGGPAVGGHVLDAVTGEPVQAEVSLDQLTFPDGRRLSSRADTGRFHIVVVPGSYTLRARAPGYEEAAAGVSVGSSFSPTVVNLVPTGASQAVFEDFEDPGSASLWSVGASGDTATVGLWAWGEPQGTHQGTIQGGNLVFGNARYDRTPGEGRYAFVTGNAAGVGFTTDDLDGGATTLVSPSFDLSGLYAVEVSWQRWFRKEASDPLDSLAAEVSTNGGASWVTLENLTATTATPQASPAWVETTVLLDDLAAPGPDVRFRFRATDGSPDNTVEAAIDDLEIRGFSLDLQGEVNGVTLLGKTSTVLGWNQVLGAPDAVYDVVRGNRANLSGGAGGVNLGPLTCIENDSSDASTSGSPDTAAPPLGTAYFYLVRFNLGFSTGGWGEGSAGGARTGTGGCAP